MPDSSPLALPIIATALAAGTLSIGALWAYSVFMPRCQFWAPVVRSLPDRDAVAFTFDDGPHTEFTPRVLDLLAAENIRAAFFVIGRFAKEYPTILRRMHTEGHTIGNHSFDHYHYGVNRKRDYWMAQIGDTQKAIADAIGREPALFRPPMGFKTRHIAVAAEAHRLPIIGWSVRGYDTKPRSAHVIAERVLRETTGHDILLLHDGVEPARTGASQQQTVEALPAIIAGIRTKKLRIVPLLDALTQPQSGARPTLLRAAS